MSITSPLAKQAAAKSSPKTRRKSIDSHINPFSKLLLEHPDGLKYLMNKVNPRPEFFRLIYSYYQFNQKLETLLDWAAEAHVQYARSTENLYDVTTPMMYILDTIFFGETIGLNYYISLMEPVTKEEKEFDFMKNEKKTLESVSKFFEGLLASVDECPVSLRHALYKLQQAVERRFPELRKNYALIKMILFSHFFGDSLSQIENSAEKWEEYQKGNMKFITEILVNFSLKAEKMETEKLKSLCLTHSPTLETYFERLLNPSEIQNAFHVISVSLPEVTEKEKSDIINQIADFFNAQPGICLQKEVNRINEIFMLKDLISASSNWKQFKEKTAFPAAYCVSKEKHKGDIKGWLKMEARLNVKAEDLLKMIRDLTILQKIPSVKHLGSLQQLGEEDEFYEGHDAHAFSSRYYQHWRTTEEVEKGKRWDFFLFPSEDSELPPAVTKGSSRATSWAVWSLTSETPTSSALQIIVSDIKQGPLSFKGTKKLLASGYSDFFLNLQKLEPK